MGFNRNGHFAALTNYRDPSRRASGAPSRGALVRDALEDTRDAATSLHDLASWAEAYAAFNLLVSDGEQLGVLESTTGAVRMLPPGVYGLSNHLLDTPWPKLLKARTGTFITHIPYRGAGPALNDTVAGQVPIIFDNMPSALPFIQSGKLVAIVVAAPQRLPQLPNVPTFKEVGLEPVNRMAYYGILGPKNLPKEVVDKISNGVKKALQDPAVTKRIQDTGSLVVANTPEEFAVQIKAEFEVYKKVVDQQKLKLD